MKRKIIHIDSENCNGCGLCAAACHEGAIGMENGKAVLLRDDYCDGLGDCLPVCPTGAITFEVREAMAYNQAAVKAIQAEKAAMEPIPQTCLKQWPIQIQLAPINAPYFHNAKLLIAADCTAFAYGNFHQEFMAGHVTLIGCPKLDPVQYAEKIGEILKQNDIKSISVVRMEVPCCSGIVNAVKEALKHTNKTLPFHITTISTKGSILESL